MQTGLYSIDQFRQIEKKNLILVSTKGFAEILT